MRDYFLLLDRVLVWIAMAALIVIMLLTVVSVTGRYLFNAPIPDDLVLNEMLLVVMVFLPFAFVQRQREHVAVTMFTDWLPPRWQLACELLAVLVGCIFFGLLAAATFTDFHHAWTVGAYVDGLLHVPEWPARFAVFFGVLMLFVRLLRDLAVAAWTLIFAPPV
jgi:TRAP-type C4-dicarboxylate transport system permease small subunit